MTGRRFKNGSSKPKTPVSDQQEVPPFARGHPSRQNNGGVPENLDHGMNDTVLHWRPDDFLNSPTQPPDRTIGIDQAGVPTARRLVLSYSCAKFLPAEPLDPV